MALNAFDLDYASETLGERIAPLWTIPELDDDEKVLDWMNKAYAIELKQISKYRELCLKHCALFRGKFYQEGSGKSTFAEASQQGLGILSSKPSKLVVNYLYQLTTERVSTLTKNRPDVSINPANSEYSDKVSARIMSYWKDYLFYQNDFDMLDAAVVLNACIMGESYIASVWDPNAGEVLKAWAEEERAAFAEKRPPRLPKMDKDGNQVMSDAGEPIYIEKPVKTGDVALQCWTPLDTIVQKCGDFKKANYYFHEEYVDVDEVRALYPDEAGKIEPDAEEDALSKWRAVAEIDIGPQIGKVLVRHFRHRPNDFLASGRQVISTRKAILVNKALPPEAKGLGLARFTDIDVPKRQWGMSFFEHGKRINAAINDLISMAMRNSKMMAHPRWVVPRGSLVKKEALGNDITMIEFQGPVKPEMIAPPNMNQELTAMRSDLKMDLQQLLGARGDVPSNVRTGSMLSLLDEQEEQRSSNSVMKHSMMIRDVVINAMNEAACYYDKDDERLLPIVGRDNRYLVKEFSPEHLTKGYNVRVRNDAGLPQSKTARAELLMEANKAVEGLVTPQKFAELMQWSDIEGFQETSTAAIKSAEAENESMLNGEQLEEPVIYEDLIVHWQTHMQEVQNRSFKTSTPEEIKEVFAGHLAATEEMMLERARKNPAFALMLMDLPLFPVFYEPSPEDFQLLDAARTGNPLSLVQVDMLYRTGQLMPGMGQVPPAGGMNNGVSQIGPMAGQAPGGGDNRQSAEQAAQPPPQQQSAR